MKKRITIPRTAHYYLQKPALEIKAVLFVIHGFGQLAEDFIKEFEFLKTTSTLVIAPEAISKFYNKNSKPVATWMTSHERLDEINDYKHYLNLLRTEVRETHGKFPTYALGFSQGVSTLLRWAWGNKDSFDGLFACSGTIPPELKPILNTNFAINYYYGLNDKLLSAENALKQIDLLKELGIAVNCISFEGRHEISSETKKDLLRISEDV